MPIEHFRARYRDARPDDLPWYHDEPDPDIVALFEKERPEPAAHAVDLGAGPAVHAIWLASAGLEVTAVDAIPEARQMALSLAEQAGVTLDYQVADVLEWRGERPADIVFDRGFLHSLDPGDRPRWRRVVTETLRPGGLLLVKAFDERPARSFGPAGLSAAAMVAALGEPVSGGLELRALLRTRFPNHSGDHGAWTLAARRLP